MDLDFYLLFTGLDFHLTFLYVFLPTYPTKLFKASLNLLHVFCFTQTSAKADCLLGKGYHSNKLYYFKIPFLSLQILMKWTLWESP